MFGEKAHQGEWAHFNSIYYRKEKIKEELVLKLSKYENLMGRKKENRKKEAGIESGGRREREEYN